MKRMVRRNIDAECVAINVVPNALPGLDSSKDINSLKYFVKNVIGNGWLLFL